MLHPDPPAVALNGGGALERAGPTLWVLGVTDHTTSAAGLVHQVPDLRGHTNLTARGKAAGQARSDEDAWTWGR